MQPLALTPKSNSGERAHPENMPKHVAVIMDGNGRWAKERSMSRIQGHRKGVDAAWGLVQHCLKKNVPHLTLFAFGQENQKRPRQEVRNLFRLFYIGLKRDVGKLHERGIQLRVIGDRTPLPKILIKAIEAAESLTKQNSKMILNLAINYSGRWDLVQAVDKFIKSNRHVDSLEVLEQALSQYLNLADQPEPDLFIRTSGVQRISNFLLWQMAYTELYFTPKYWPDFDEAELEKAFAFYARNERRFGLTSEQVQQCLNIES